MQSNKLRSYFVIQHHCPYGLRKFNFTNRVISIWNSLYNHVISVDTINTFKDRLNKFWANQDVLYCMITRQISMASGTPVL